MSGRQPSRRTLYCGECDDYTRVVIDCGEATCQRCGEFFPCGECGHPTDAAGRCMRPAEMGTCPTLPAPVPTEYGSAVAEGVALLRGDGRLTVAQRRQLAELLLSVAEEAAENRYDAEQYRTTDDEGWRY